MVTVNLQCNSPSQINSSIFYRLKIVPYSYKFSRDVNFAVFADSVWSTKIKLSKIYIL